MLQFTARPILTGHQRSGNMWMLFHMAAGSYTWENVAMYDNTFRRLMSEYPDCSWAETYTQMWQLSMRDPLPKRFGGRESSTPGDRDNYCWKFQQNQKHDIALCRFDHRCKYCDGFLHGFNACRKRKKGGESRDSENTPGKQVTAETNQKAPPTKN